MVGSSLRRRLFAFPVPRDGLVGNVDTLVVESTDFPRILAEINMDALGIVLQFRKRDPASPNDDFFSSTETEVADSVSTTLANPGLRVMALARVV